MHGRFSHTRTGAAEQRMTSLHFTTLIATVRQHDRKVDSPVEHRALVEARAGMGPDLAFRVPAQAGPATRTGHP